MRTIEACLISLSELGRMVAVIEVARLRNMSVSDVLIFSSFVIVDLFLYILSLIVLVDDVACLTCQS